LETEFTALKADFSALQNELEHTRTTLAKGGQSEVSSSTTTDWSSSTLPPNAANIKKILQDKITQLQAMTSEKEGIQKQLISSEVALSESNLKLKKVNEELDEATEKCIRLEIITSSLNRCKVRVEELTTELSFQKSQNEELVKQLEKIQLFKDLPPTSQSQPEIVDSTEKPTNSRKRNISGEQSITSQDLQSSTPAFVPISPKRICIQPEQDAVTSNFDEFAAATSNEPNTSYNAISIEDDVFDGDMIVPESGLKVDDEIVANVLDDAQVGGSANEVQPLDLSLNDAEIEMGEQPIESDYQLSAPSYADNEENIVYGGQSEEQYEEEQDYDEEEQEYDEADLEEGFVDEADYGDEIDESNDDGDHVEELDDSADIICLSDGDDQEPQDDDMVGASGQDEEDKTEEAPDNQEL